MLSRVWGLFLIEAKSVLSIALLIFYDGSREAYHNHAFNAWSWVLSGKLIEHMKDGTINVYTPSLFPIYTSREDFHKVVSEGTTVVLTFRGPWRNWWNEFTENHELITLTHGRQVV